jgi:hypothetical protein
MNIKCDQCEAAMINGIFCHETGCPNARKRWDGDCWLIECGAEYDEKTDEYYVEVSQ